MFTQEEGLLRREEYLKNILLTTNIPTGIYLQLFISQQLGNTDPYIMHKTVLLFLSSSGSNETSS